MVTQTPKRHYTIEEYLALEETAQFRNEYRNGEIVPMTGGTTNHNKIVGNFYAYLKFALRGQGYDLYTSDVRLWIPRYGQYTYPDVMVIQGKPVYEGAGTTTVTNPLMIVEVLSKSTQAYDRAEKFKYYRSIPEFQEYILIDQYQFSVEQFAKTSDGKWLLTEYESETDVLSLSSINFQIAFNGLYEGVIFNSPEE